MSAQSDRGLVSAVASAKAFHAGAIRTYLYQKVNGPAPIWGVSVKDMTTAIADHINRLAGDQTGPADLILPLVTSTDVNLANVDSHGRLPQQ